MRDPIILGCLLLVILASCGPAAQGKTGNLAGPPTSVKVPPAITDKNYEIHRDHYDALEIDTRGRDAFRKLLLGHLLQQLDRHLARGEEAEAAKVFQSCLTLFDPVEVYGGTVRGHTQLARAAARLVAVFSPRGDERKVLPPLCVQMTLEPDNKQLRDKFRQITTWMQETGELASGHSRKWLRTVQVLEATVKLWPSALVVEQVRKAYVEQRVSIARAFHISPLSHLRGAVSALFQTGFKVARNYLMVDLMGEALRRLEEVASDRSPDEELRRLLQQALAKGAGAEQLVQLAAFFEERDREVALRICRRARRRFPDNAKVNWCVGRLAAKLLRTTLSVKSLERAVSLDPTRRGYVELLAQQYQRRLFSLIGDEKLKQAQGELDRIEAFYRRSSKQFKTSIDPPLSRVYYAIGHGFYNAGRVGPAATAFEKSVAVSPSPEALVQLATIRTKQHRPAESRTFLERAEKLTMPNAHARAYWQGRIESLRGESLELEGKAEASRKAHLQATQAWQSLLALGLDDDDKAEAYTYEARSLFAIGERAKGMDALDRAVDVLPDRKETYADVIALLTTYGHMPEALDAYHRALGRREVSEYLKSYCSFWIIGLARRAGLPPDPLAMSHLSNLKGSAWYAELARLIRGQVTYVQLVARAKGPSNLAELYYYQADLLLAAGKQLEAQSLWKKVLATDMMAFYEFDMATFNLTHGPSKVLTSPIDRQRSSAYKSDRTTDDDSPSNRP